MAAYLGLTLCLSSEGVEHPSVVASNYDAVDMTSILNVGVIGNSLVARRCKGLVCRQTSAL